MVNYGSLNFLFTVFQTQILILWSRSCPLLTMVGWTHKAQFHPENSIQAPFSIMVSSWNLVRVRCSHLLAGLVWSNSLILWPCSRPEAVLQSLLPMVWKYFWQPHRNAPWAVCDGKWLVMCWLLPGVFVRSFNFLRFATKWFSDTLVFQQKKKVEEEKKKNDRTSESSREFTAHLRLSPSLIRNRPSPPGSRRRKTTFFLCAITVFKVVFLNTHRCYFRAPLAWLEDTLFELWNARVKRPRRLCLILYPF